MPAPCFVGCWCQENQLVAVKFEWQNAEKTVARKNFAFVLEEGIRPLSLRVRAWLRCFEIGKFLKAQRVIKSV